ncbi:GSCFA domain-containing protein [Paraflavitalea sp. CAU 1676]|uniref:GSCFA domain-containing protein n=1 Tax=Paraflavitalea sp. CAU 1676 TaxID=3032598 RepID=UPI0023DA1E11|nr:GSCFA domain-containing protein [Paraflavitalea sp. CAU 1676]MDF2187780.1 GSCFA domain-containing protein [Paraflavitalea sp. CAU 1676]
MDFMLDINIPAPKDLVNYREPILLTGSCFTEHIGNSLQDLKFDVLQNPNGILFDPASVAASLVSYVQNKQYSASDLFHLHEVWQSWHHHSRFSHVDWEESLQMINASQQRAHDFLKRAKWLIITLGSAFSYRLTDNAPADAQIGFDTTGSVAPGRDHAVANCHRAPGQWFRKHLMTIEEINTVLDNSLYQVLKFNPSLRVIFTVSPVRHIRDGVVDNNRSKARLLEVVHHLVNKFDRMYYFPAYELVIDVLRDYRFYDIDMVHPNYPATSFVLEHFMKNYTDAESQQAAAEVQKIVIARKHKPFHPATEAHKKFLASHAVKAKELQERYPFLNLEEEIRYFNSML